MTGYLHLKCLQICGSHEDKSLISAPSTFNNASTFLKLSTKIELVILKGKINKFYAYLYDICPRKNLFDEKMAAAVKEKLI